MADEEPAHECTLFVVATMSAMYLRVSDLVGRENWRSAMGYLRRDTMGNWWIHLRLSPLPSPQEKTPLITALNGCGGLSDRHRRSLLWSVFDQALHWMHRRQSEGACNEDQSIYAPPVSQ
ncbi:hypothetical protein [Pseudomonas sp. Irchel s3a18]|uniref:hypothetical protein n=1 Tax=Pseudomonas sp. Irchel s3a18 TaxID=2009053 RepID=UPI001179F786